MYKRRRSSVRASEVADYLNKNLIGTDVNIRTPATLSRPENDAILCVTNKEILNLDTLSGLDGLLFLTYEALPESKNYCFIVCENPKLDFVLVLQEFFLVDEPHVIDPTAIVAETASVAVNVAIGANSIIGPDVSIDENTVIMNNVVISGLVKIGADCVIKNNAVIGSEGYNFVTDDQGRPLHIPPLGAIVIGDQVWIGANTTLERAELKDTTISSQVKVDDLVNVGGGSCIGSRTMITAGAVVGT